MINKQLEEDIYNATENEKDFEDSFQEDIIIINNKTYKVL